MRDSADRLSNRRRQRRTLLILLGVLLFFSFLLLHIWFSSKAVELVYEIDNLVAEKEVLEEENRKLSLRIAELKSPERISRIATTDLKMIRSSDAQVIALER